jgi:hypothetical protein
MCGIYGRYYEPNNINTTTIIQPSIVINNLYNQLYELENNFNGEIYEKDEIKKWEEEISNIKQTINTLKNTINNNQ